MSSGIVKAIKKYQSNEVFNAVVAVGWHWKNPRRAPTNIEEMLMGIPKQDLHLILNELNGSAEKKRKTLALIMPKEEQDPIEWFDPGNGSFTAIGTTTGRIPSQHVPVQQKYKP